MASGEPYRHLALLFRGLLRRASDCHFVIFSFAFPLWRLRLELVAIVCFHRVTSVFNSCELRLETYVTGFGL